MSTNNYSSDNAEPVELKLEDLLQKAQSVLIVFGATGAGKTTLVNTLARCNLEVGESLKSCTADIQGAIVMYKDISFVICDTPGFDDSGVSEEQTINKIAEFLASKDQSNGNKARCVSGVIFVHDIEQKKMAGAARRGLSMFKAIVGPEDLGKVVFVTNQWSSPPSEKEAARQKELETDDELFGVAIQAGARTVHTKTDPQHEDVVQILDMFLESEPFTLLMQRELAEGKKVIETSAGSLVHDNLNKAIKEKDKEIAELKKKTAEAEQSNNSKTVQDVRDKLAQAENDKAKVKESVERLRSSPWERAMGVMVTAVASVPTAVLAGSATVAITGVVSITGAVVLGTVTGVGLGAGAGFAAWKLVRRS